MSLIKDGKIYRTPEEQLLHLTEKHLEQVTFNENVSKKLQELTVASNLGGYNLVRNSFSPSKSFSIKSFSCPYLDNNKENLIEGQFITFETKNTDDIPAYGFVGKDKNIVLHFIGDYANETTYVTVTIRELGISAGCDVVMEERNSTCLLSLNPNNFKKQVFTVLHDSTYGCKTQYVSYDINGDDDYHFVYIGTISNGVDGRSIFAVNNGNYNFVSSQLKSGDLVLFLESIYNIPVGVGCIAKFLSSNNYEVIGSILGPKGERGEKGEKGDQGIQGVQGVQGIQGEKGERGEKGKDGDGLDIKTGILNSPSELPDFYSTEIGDAYRIINTSGSIVSYDLYFKASNGADWDIQPNWGGVKGDKGDKGDAGIQGIQGVQGIQGERGPTGSPRYTHNIFFDMSYAGATRSGFNVIIYSDKEDEFTPSTFVKYLYDNNMSLNIKPYAWDSSNTILSINASSETKISFVGLSYALVTASSYGLKLQQVVSNSASYLINFVDNII